MGLFLKLRLTGVNNSSTQFLIPFLTFVEWHFTCLKQDYLPAKIDIISVSGLFSLAISLTCIPVRADNSGNEESSSF